MINSRTFKFSLIFLLAFLNVNLVATNLYWVGGTGNWSDSNHWAAASGGASGAGVPTLVDNVFFDVNSFNGAGQTVSASGAITNCLTMDWTGVTNTPNFDVFNATIYINGSLILNPAMTLSSASNNYFYFVSTNAGNIINTYGLTLPNSFVFFEGISGEWTLLDNLNIGAAVYLTSGNFYTDGYTVTCAQFNSSGSNIRGLSIANSTINIFNNSWNDSGTNFGIDPTNSIINFTGTGGTMNCGNNEYNNINFTDPNANCTINNGLGFNKITFNGIGTLSSTNASINELIFMKTGTINGANNSILKAEFRSTGSLIANTNFDTLKATPGGSISFYPGTIHTVSIFQVDGTCAQRVWLSSSSSTNRPTINCTNPTAVMNYVQMYNLSFIGGAVITANNSIDFENNSGIVINPPVSQTLYWRGNTGNWDDATHWSTTSGGPAGTCIPSKYDNVVFDANSFTTISKIMTVNTTAYCKNMTWTGTISNAQWAGTAEIDIYGSLTLVSNMNRTYTGQIVFVSSATANTITSAGKVFANNIYFYGTGSWTLQDAINTTTANIYLVSGTLNTNGKNVTCNNFYSNYTTPRSLTLGSSTINVNGGTWNDQGANYTLNAGTSTIVLNVNGSYADFYFASGVSYYNITAGSNAVGLQLVNYDAANTAIFHNLTCNTRLSSFGASGNVILNKLQLNVTNSTVGPVGHYLNVDSLVVASGLTVLFSENTTVNIGSNISADGTAGDLTEFYAYSPGYVYYLNKVNCTACLNYMDIRGSQAGGGAQFYAANSTNSGGNTGWNFAACPSTTLTVGPITGPANTCINGTNYTYSIPAVSGGTYTWTVPSGATILSGQGTNSIYVSVGSIAGTVSVSVTACGNVGTANLPITVNPNPTITNISVTPATCSNADGSATATVTGGTPTYYYRWSSADTLATAPALAAGQYQLLVFDIYGCRTTANTTIVASDGPSISVVSTTPTSCYGGANATAQISVTGGTTPYVILWSNGASTLSTTGLTAGPYEVTVTDANECGASQSITITGPTAMSNSFTISPSACAGSTGSAQANVTGGTGAYTYLWDGSAANQTTSLASNLAAGVYQVVVTDANLCQTTFNATVPNTATTLASAISGIVAGDCGPNSAGSATLDATGGAGSYVYLWSNGANTATITGVTPGNYYCTVTDASLCSSSQSVTIPSSVGNITQAICMVTVDTATFTNQVIWEKLITNDIQSFKIYRESNITNVYTNIATVPFTAISEYTDPVANPAIHAWRYKITAVDSCGVETPYSAPHKTIHLAQNLGVGGEINLSWDQYEGFPYYSYYIWRHDPSTGWEPLDTLSTNYTTYTDFVPPSSDSRYMIEVRPQAGCTSTMRLAGGNDINTVVVKSKSNIKNNRTVGIKDSKNQETRFKVYPNPATDMLNVDISLIKETQATITIENMLGQVVYSKQTTQHLNQFNISTFVSGVYFVKVNTGKGISVEKIIIE